MTTVEARELIAKILAGFPNQQLDEANIARYAQRMEQFAARDRQFIVDVIDERRLTFFPSLPDLVGIATDVTIERIRAEEITRNHQVIEEFKLASGMTDAQAASNVARLKVMTADYLHRVNEAKRANKGLLPDDWERTPPEAEQPNTTRCPACNGSDKRCRVCDGTGLVCPTCRGAHILTEPRVGSELPLYVGCPDCTDWNNRNTHEWDAQNWPKFTRDRDRERHAIHAARSRRRAA